MDGINVVELVIVVFLFLVVTVHGLRRRPLAAGR